MLKNKVISILLLCFSLNCFAADESLKHIEDIQDSSKYVEDDYNNWLNDVAIPDLKKSCQENNYDLSLPFCSEKSLFYGDGIITLPPEDPHWVNARMLAYESAMLDAYKKVVEHLALDYKTKILQSLIRDTEDPKFEDDEKSMGKVLLDKLLALADGKLNEKLRELGIEPEKFKNASNSVKKTMLEDAISIEGAKRAISDTSGMIPYQTFEGADIFGNHVIRVVMSMDPNRTALVKSMLSNQGAIQPNMYKISKKSLRDRLLLDKETLFHQFGTRLFYDEKGYPVLVSFGQSSIENETSRAAQAAKLKVAKENASTFAMSNLTALLNSQTLSKNTVKELIKYLEEKRLIKDENSASIIEELSQNTVYENKIDSQIELTGRINNFSGVKEYHTWAYEHPQYKHKIYGLILVWSPELSNQAKQLKMVNAKSTQGAVEGDFSQQVPAKVIRGMESDF